MAKKQTDGKSLTYSEWKNTKGKRKKANESDEAYLARLDQEYSLYVKKINDKRQIIKSDLKNRAAKAGMDVDKYKASKKIKPKKTGGFRDSFLEAPIEEI